MIGGYANTYIRLLHDDARKYCPNTKSTNVHIVPQISVQKARLEYETLSIDMPIGVDQNKDKIIISKEGDMFPSYNCWYTRGFIRYAKHPFDDNNTANSSH